MLVDKNKNYPTDPLNNPNKSIFSIGDYRHNLVLKEDTEKYTSLVGHKPKEFLAWDDGKKFNQKYAKDK